MLLIKTLDILPKITYNNRCILIECRENTL